MDETKKCKECFCVYPVEFFAKKNSDIGIRHARCIARCIGCQQTKRDLSGKYMAKARSTIANHAKKYTKQFNITLREFEDRFGWECKKIADDFKKHFQGECPYCGKAYQDMKNGLREITLDIIDRDSGPYYAINVQTCCYICNTKKGRKTPDEWGLHLRCFEIWEENKTRLKSMPQQQHLF